MSCAVRPTAVQGSTDLTDLRRLGRGIAPLDSREFRGTLRLEAAVQSLTASTDLRPTRRDGPVEGPDRVSSQHTLDIRSVAAVMNGHATAVGTRTQEASGLLEPLRNHHRYEMLSDLNRSAVAAAAVLRVASSIFSSS